MLLFLAGRTANREGKVATSLAVSSKDGQAKDAMTNGPASAPAGNFHSSNLLVATNFLYLECSKVSLLQSFSIDFAMSQVAALSRNLSPLNQYHVHCKTVILKNRCPHPSSHNTLLLTEI